MFKVMISVAGQCAFPDVQLVNVYGTLRIFFSVSGFRSKFKDPADLFMRYGFWLN